MKLLIPQRDVILAKVPIFTRVKPLKRPRANMHNKAVYQPLANQRALLMELKTNVQLFIDEPVFVDVYINFTRSKLVKDRHPILKRTQGDIDNLAKAINDGLVKARILTDDHLIIGQTITKAYGDEDLVVVVIWSACQNTEESKPWALSSAPTSQQPSEPLSLTSALESVF